jgi:hypothetical protein
MERNWSFSFMMTKAKSIIATREFNAIDNSAYTVFYDQAKKQGEGKVIDIVYRRMEVLPSGLKNSYDFRKL